MDSDDDFVVNYSERPGTPIELVQSAAKANQELLPTKSKNRYEEAYNSYEKWKGSKGATSNSETVLLAYISEMANTKNEYLKPTTLWARYSMLKAMLNILQKVDISSYATVTAFLKRKSDGYVPKKARVFTEIEIQQFLDSASDEVWLDVKVVCVFCMFGTGRTHKLLSVRMSDIARYGDMYFVTIPTVNTKTKEQNSFATRGAMLDIVRKYENLRLANVITNRFFLNYQRGKCTVQLIAKS
ncbi:hypothetical protein Bhyg_10866 [Pseudolycoriella hygida]|uniref:Uncharacterized protein n=1 Tax=Pseudolycoriella hygida TaxID=35572 RepID=A0A9Q0RZQ5_9DIPT|nr:hypothetical protein Bhyg_10866 [Pseudolycoriella hygida]